jgi:hypothetical protein
MHGKINGPQTKIKSFGENVQKPTIKLVAQVEQVSETPN